MVAVVAKIDEHNARVPAYEQWMTVGAATSNFLAALELKGYAGKIVSGRCPLQEGRSHRLLDYARNRKTECAGR